MPSRRCHHPTCDFIVPAGGRCPAHGSPRAAVHRRYEQHNRDREAKAFYASAAWRRAREAKLAKNPVCERCLRVFANTVHHRKPLKECDERERVAQDNLQSVCPPCHSAIEAEIAAAARSSQA